MQISRVLRALAIVAPLLAGVVFYLPTLGGGFLSDDYSVLGALYAWASEQRLFTALLAKLVEGLDAPSHYYRPIAMMSFGANYVLSGAHPLPWRLTNLAIHCASGALVFVVALRLGEWAGSRASTAAAAIASAVFIAFPTNVEAVAWVSGRYDLLALAFMLATVACFQRSRRWGDGWGVAALLTAACALASKESAALLPAFVLAVAIGRHWHEGSRRALAQGVRDALPWLALGIAYFALRSAIFGTPFRVYPGSSPVEALLSGAWLKPLVSTGAWLEAAMPSPAARLAFLTALAALIALGAFALVDRPLARGAWVAIAVTAVLSIVLLLPHIVALATNGEQGRLYYTTSALLALLAAFPWFRVSSVRLRFRSVLTVVVTAGLLASEAVVLRAAMVPWSEAGAQVNVLLASLARTADTIPPAGYALVVVPDHVGTVPFGRNAQGGLISPPVQAGELSHRLVVQTPRDLPPWPEHIARGFIDALRRYPLSAVWVAVAQGKTVGAEAPTHYFCWAVQAQELVPLPWSAELAVRDWLAEWKGALAASGCDDSARELALF
ncbi:MAG TPA: hypothetical protein VKG21_00750 [Casimicrobiaceae bacterium]|nr:hypothetical protein [Casimicrobiaceae bacterium]